MRSNGLLLGVRIIRNTSHILLVATLLALWVISGEQVLAIANADEYADVATFAPPVDKQEYVPDGHTTPKIVLADSQPANEPMGTAQGIFPGRVVWVHDADATNENCTNTYTPVEDGWFLPKNNNQAVIDKMVSQMIRSLTGENSDEAAWDALFKNFNSTKGRRNAGYLPGQKIMIKANFTSAWGWGSDYPNINSADYSIVKNSWYGIAETSPQVVLAFLRQLVNVYGVRQQDISVGDPLNHIYKRTYDLLHTEFQNVIYIDHQSSTLGRTPIVPSATPELYFSDRGTILHEDGNSTPVYSDYLPTCITEANYMINIASLNGDARAGITLCAKNHFGSHCREDASHLYEGLVSPDGTSQSRAGMGLYRIHVDLMGHKFLGGNTVLNVVDGLWGGSESIEKPEKWLTAPFNNDYTSSIFASQDQVALESVCFNFLKAEFTQANHPDNYWPQMDGVDDYLHQAADPNNWPADINYDPENDGTLIGSLGVHEHWNDANNKQYTRNLDPVNGKGIELFNPALDHYCVSITKCTVTAGKNNMGTISISGVMDVNANDINDVNSFTITVTGSKPIEQPYFIVGSWGKFKNGANCTTADSNFDSFSTMMSQGINTVIIGADSQLPAYFAEANSSGMKIIVDLEDLLLATSGFPDQNSQMVVITGYVNTYKDNPNLAGWLIADEPDGDGGRLSYGSWDANNPYYPDDIVGFVRSKLGWVLPKIKALDSNPEHKIFITLEDYPNFSPLSDCYEILLPHKYPTWNTTSEFEGPATNIIKEAQWAYEAAVESNSPQTHGFCYNPDISNVITGMALYRPPTINEIRYSFFAPITQGSVGVMGWNAHRCDDTNDYKTQQVYPVFKQVSQLAEYFAGARLQGNLYCSPSTPASPSTTVPGRQYLYFIPVWGGGSLPETTCALFQSRNGHYLALVVNNSPDTLTEATIQIDLPNLPTTTMDFLTNTTFAITGNTVTFNMTPYGVRAFII